MPIGYNQATANNMCVIELTSILYFYPFFLDCGDHASMGITIISYLGK